MQSNLGLREKSEERGGEVNEWELLRENGFFRTFLDVILVLMVNEKEEEISLLGCVCI